MSYVYILYQVSMEVHMEDEKASTSPRDEKRIVSPTDKDEGLKETAEDELKIQKLGTMYFNVEYDKQKLALIVTIIRAAELPAKDPNVGSSDPYIKLQLLPEKRHKVCLKQY